VSDNDVLNNNNILDSYEKSVENWNKIIKETTNRVKAMKPD